MKYAKGVMWLDDTRIPFVDADKESINFDRPRVRASINEDWILKQAHDYTNPDHKEYNTQGRFTPNLLVCDDMLNDGKVSVSEGGKTTRDTAHFGAGTFKMEGYGDKGSNSRYYDLDLWFDKMLERL
jgi:hypothetical protein